VSLHLALAKLDPSCLIEALSIYYNLHYCRRTGFPPLLLDLVYRSFLPTRPCIHRVCHLFPHFCLLCICYDIPLFWPNYGYVFLHKKTKSALEKCSPLRLFSFKQTISDIFFTKNTMELWDIIHRLSYLPTGYLSTALSKGWAT
jgi:hypothetical protein